MYFCSVNAYARLFADRTFSVSNQTIEFSIQAHGLAPYILCIPLYHTCMELHTASIHEGVASIHEGVAFCPQGLIYLLQSEISVPVPITKEFIADKDAGNNHWCGPKTTHVCIYGCMYVWVDVCMCIYTYILGFIQG